MGISYTDLPSYGDSHWKAPVNTATSLPSTGNQIGDVRVAEDTSVIYVWTGSSWQAEGGTGGVVLNSGTATPASGVGTITNLPSGYSGNPTGYLEFTINGTTHVLPYW
jgi:hypothetical protein